jgi:hypothetical protein
MKRAREILIELGAKLRPPVDSLVIDAVTGGLGLTIPKEARELYLEANGSTEDFGEWSWHFWSIDSDELTLGSYLKRPRDYVISPSSRKIDPKKYVRFVDCLIDAPLYAYCADQTSPHFGEVIGCFTDNGTFYAFVSTSSVSRFLELLSATRGDEVILTDEKEEPNETVQAAAPP